MKIKSIRSEQFAGIQDKEAKFNDGLNLVIGDNETGKSTLVDLLYSVLFQNVKLSKISDKVFIDRYFPKNASGSQGDSIDGAVVFETDEGTYRLNKEWDSDGGSVKLTLPNGTRIRNEEEINSIIKDILTHEQGVYSEIVFASQKRDQMAVESIMTVLTKKSSDLSETRDALASTLGQAVMETGGVSIDLIEKRLDERLTKLSGNWDFDYDLPKGGRKHGVDNPWKRNVGEILQAYYDMETIREQQEAARSAEEEVETCRNTLKKLQQSKEEQERSLSDFQKYARILETADSLEESITERTVSISEKEEILESWPASAESLKKANELKERKVLAEIHDRYLKAEGARKAYEAAAARLKNLKKVDPEDVKSAEKAERAVQAAESRINGMNLEAAIKKTGDTPIEIRKVSDNEPVDLSSGKISITEAVTITIPGVMEMELMPKGININEVKKELQESGKTLTGIFKKYDADNLDELREAEEQYANASDEAEEKKKELEDILDGQTWKALKTKNANVPEDIETEEEVDELIEELCEDDSLDEYIGGIKTSIRENEKKYSSVKELKKIIGDEKTRLAKLQKELDAIGDIPEEYRDIDDPQEYEQDCRDALEDLDNKIKDANSDCQEAYRKLGDKSSEEFEDELSAAEELFDSKKTEYAHWNHIQSVFLKMKEDVKGNPTGDIEQKFREYLNVITDGAVKISDMDEKMFVSLESGMHALTYDTLSEGTKDTISLAFRLAMLEHLFPEGNGLAVFDDPFTDMDPTRTEHACKLINKFAENNQVIFVTCDSKYKDLLNGKTIQFGD